MPVAVEQVEAHVVEWWPVDLSKNLGDNMCHGVEEEEEESGQEGRPMLEEDGEMSRG